MVKKISSAPGWATGRVFCLEHKPADHEKNSEGTASDGQLYFITSLLFASNRWGNGTGINYYGEARGILDACGKKMEAAASIT